MKKRSLPLYFLAMLFATTSLMGKERGKHVDNFARLYDERLRSCVVVQYTVKYYLDQEKKVVNGVVIDNEGTIVLNSFDIPNNVSIEQLSDFKVYPLWKRSQGHEAEYLGSDNLLELHYLKAKGDVVKEMKSIRDYKRATAKQGDPVWGISVLEFQNDCYESALHRSQVSFIDHSPYRVGWAQSFVCTAGMPTFNRKGEFVGWGILPLNSPYQIDINGQKYMTQLTPSGRTERFLFAEDFFHYLKGAPKNIGGDPIPSIGVIGADPLNPKALAFFGLEESSGIVIGNVVENSPASKSGILPGDIILGIDGLPIPFFAASYAYPEYLALLIREKKIGDKVTFQIFRNREIKDFEVVIEAAAKGLSQAKREYLPEYGMALREYTLDDGVKRNVFKADAGGVIVDFVKYNSPADDASVKPGDWIKRIDDHEVTNYADAIALIHTAKDDTSRKYFILLVQRDNETRVLRIRK